jgi:inosine/xanthosine triphosphate pyrophosphatase family protein
MKIVERTFNAETGETVDIERNETAQEKSEREQTELKRAALIAEAEAKETQRQAIADRLGLTADELKLLLG